MGAQLDFINPLPQTQPKWHRTVSQVGASVSVADAQAQLQDLLK